MMARALALLAVAVVLAGCIQTSPQLKRYQADRDAMMSAGNKDQR